MNYLTRFPTRSVRISSGGFTASMREEWVKELRDTLHDQRSEALGIASMPMDKETFAVVDEDGRVRFVRFHDLHCTIGGEEIALESEEKIASMREEEKDEALSLLGLDDPGRQERPFDVNAWIEENREDQAEDSSWLTVLQCPELECADGFTMSVQASADHNCSPRSNEGPYSTVEVGFPSEREELLMDYIGRSCDPESPTEAVYNDVPTEIVASLVDVHGGLA